MHTHTLSYSSVCLSVCLSIINMHTYRHTNAVRHTIIHSSNYTMHTKKSLCHTNIIVDHLNPLTPPITTTLHKNSGSVIQGGYILTV